MLMMVMESQPRRSRVLKFGGSMGNCDFILGEYGGKSSGSFRYYEQLEDHLRESNPRQLSPFSQRIVSKPSGYSRWLMREHCPQSRGIYPSQMLTLEATKCSASGYLASALYISLSTFAGLYRDVEIKASAICEVLEIQGSRRYHIEERSRNPLILTCVCGIKLYAKLVLRPTRRERGRRSGEGQISTFATRRYRCCRGRQHLEQTSSPIKRQTIYLHRLVKSTIPP
jgi:hypothetical protein